MASRGGSEAPSSMCTRPFGWNLKIAESGAPHFRRAVQRNVVEITRRQRDTEEVASMFVHGRRFPLHPDDVPDDDPLVLEDLGPTLAGKGRRMLT